VKFYALKALPGLKITEITHLIISSLKQMVIDKNQLVRKVAALTVLKLRDLTPDEVTSE
jgi:vesicle coat complex subunit